MYGQRAPSFRGQIPIQSSLDYEIPQSFISRNQGQPQEEQVDPSNDIGKIEDPVHPLAARGKLTSDYYNNYAQLEQYAKSMAKDFGVDIFKPDYTQEGGGHAFQLAQKLQANIMYAANALRNEFGAEKDRRKSIDEGKLLRKHGVDYNNTLAYSDDNNFTPTAALPGITEANVRGREDTYDPQSAARINQQIQAQSAQIDQLVQSGQLSPEEGQLQKSYLIKNTYKIAPSMFDDANGHGKPVKTMIPLYEHAANITRGAFDSGKDKVVRGKHYITSDVFSGDNYGEVQLPKKDKLGNSTMVEVKKKIKGVLKDSSGKVFLEFEDPEIPLEEVSSQNPDEVFRKLVESNSGKYGGAGSLPAFYDELQKKGYLRQDRTVHPGTVYGEGTVEKTNVKPKYQDYLDFLMKEDKKVYDSTENGDEFEKTAPTGKLKFKRTDKKGLYLENWKEFGYTKQPDHLDYDSYQNVLDDQGYHQAFIDKLNRNATSSPANSSTAKSKTITSAQLKSFIGKPGYEGYDEKELADYYKSQGYTIQ